MNSLTNRVWISAVVMIFGLFGTSWVRSENTIEISALHQNLDTLPMELNGYHGADIPLDEHIREVLDADALMNRVYKKTNEPSIACHVSAWMRPEFVRYGVPHLPKICYTGAGWKIINEKTSEISLASGKLKLHFLLVERDTSRSVVAYWYQIGNSTFTTTAEAKQSHMKLWGQKQWPALLKVMLDTPAQSIDSAMPQIEKFAVSVLEWTHQL